MLEKELDVKDLHLFVTRDEGEHYYVKFKYLENPPMRRMRNSVLNFKTETENSVKVGDCPNMTDYIHKIYYM